MRKDDGMRHNGFRIAAISPTDSSNTLLADEHFQSVLYRESKRSERSRKHVLLMLIDHGNACENPSECRSLGQAADALGSVIRETDIVGWFDPNCVLGVIFTEFGRADVTLATEAIEGKITESLQRVFTAQQLNKLHVSFYAFPDQQPGHEKPTARGRHQITELNGRGSELHVGNSSVLQLSSRVAELCSPSQRLRLD